MLTIESFAIDMLSEGRSGPRHGGAGSYRGKYCEGRISGATPYTSKQLSGVTKLVHSV